jgi:alcohol oxidase
VVIGETARRMDAYAGEVQNMHPFYDFDSPARAKDMDLLTTKAYALPGNLTAGIQHVRYTPQPLSLSFFSNEYYT